MKAKKRFKEHACAFKNEAECEEELNDDGLSLDDAEEEFFDSDD